MDLSVVVPWTDDPVIRSESAASHLFGCFDVLICPLEGVRAVRLAANTSVSNSVDWIWIEGLGKEDSRIGRESGRIGIPTRKTRHKAPVVGRSLSESIVHSDLHRGQTAHLNSFKHGRESS
jgi:hypothetical protein